MLSHLVAQLVDQYIREFLGDWDPVQNLQIGSFTEPEIKLRNVPLPQVIFDLAEIPFSVDYSNIASVHGKFSWSTLLGRFDKNPLLIHLEDAEIRLRFMYPSEWDPVKWEEKLLKAKLKRAEIWRRFASVFATQIADKSLSQSLECRILNALRIRAKNIHIQIVDDHFSSVPFAFDVYVAEFNIDGAPEDDPRLTGLEREGLHNHLLSALWMRFISMHVFYKEFSAPVFPARARRRRCGSVQSAPSTLSVTSSIPAEVDDDSHEAGAIDRRTALPQCRNLPGMANLPVVSDRPSPPPQDDDMSTHHSVSREMDTSDPTHRVRRPKVSRRHENLMSTLVHKKPPRLPSHPLSYKTKSRSFSKSVSELLTRLPHTRSFSRRRREPQSERSWAQSPSTAFRAVAVHGRAFETTPLSFSNKGKLVSPLLTNAPKELKRRFCRQAESITHHMKQHQKLKPSDFSESDVAGPTAEASSIAKADAAAVGWIRSIFQQLRGVRRKKKDDFPVLPQCLHSSTYRCSCRKMTTDKTSFDQTSSEALSPRHFSRSASSRASSLTSKSSTTCSQVTKVSQNSSSSLIRPPRDMEFCACFGNPVFHTSPSHARAHQGKASAVQYPPAPGKWAQARRKKRRRSQQGLPTTARLFEENSSRQDRVELGSEEAIPSSPRQSSFGKKDILPPNDKAYRITDFNGLEMHILFKKWEIRALSVLELSAERWKHIELSFIPHVPPATCSPDPDKEPTSMSSDGAPALGARAPVFDGSAVYGPLNVSFTGAALEAFFNFIKFLDLWFVFIRGCARPIRQDPTPELCQPYAEIWKKFVTGAKLTEEQQQTKEHLERLLPLYAILSVRSQAESEAWSSLGIAGFARHLGGRVQGACQGAVNMCTPGALLPQYSDGDTCRVIPRSCRTYSPKRDTELVVDQLEEEPMTDGDEQKPTANTNYRWFFRDSFTEVILPDLRCEVIPSVMAGRHIQGTPLQPLAPTGAGPVFSEAVVKRWRALRSKRPQKSNASEKRDGDIVSEPLSYAKCTETARCHETGRHVSPSATAAATPAAPDAGYDEIIRAAMPVDAVAHMGSAAAFVICASVRYVADKTHDHIKSSRVLIDNTVIVERPAEFLLSKSQTVVRRYYRHRVDVQLELPAYLITSRRVPGAPLSLVMSCMPHYMDWFPLLSQISMTRDHDIFTPVVLHPDDDAQWKPVSRNALSAVVLARSVAATMVKRLRKSAEGTTKSTTSETFPNVWPGQSIFETWKRSLRTVQEHNERSEDNNEVHSSSKPPLLCRKPLIEPTTRMSILFSDDMLANKKKTTIVIPQCVVDAVPVLEIAASFPPKFNVDRDLFDDVDYPIPDMVNEAHNIGCYCAPTIRSLEVQIPKAYVLVQSHVHSTLRKKSADALRSGLFAMGYTIPGKPVDILAQSVATAHVLPHGTFKAAATTDQSERKLTGGQTCTDQHEPPVSKNVDDDNEEKFFPPFCPTFRALGTENEPTKSPQNDGATAPDALAPDGIKEALLRMAPLVNRVIVTASDFVLHITPDKSLTVDIAEGAVFTSAPLAEHSLETKAVDDQQRPELQGFPSFPFFKSATCVLRATNFSLRLAGPDRPAEDPSSVLVHTILTDPSSASPEVASFTSSVDPHNLASPSQPSSESTTERVLLGCETIEIGIEHTMLSLVCCWRAFTCPGVDFNDILYRILAFGSSRRLNPKTHKPEYNDKFVWRPKLGMVYLGSFEGPSYGYDEEQHRQFDDPFYGGVTLVDFMQHNSLSKNSISSQFESNDPSSEVPPASVRARDPIRLDLSCSVTRISVLVYDAMKARLSCQFHSFWFHFIKQTTRQSCECQVAELHCVELAPLSQTTITQSIVICKNVGHLGADARLWRNSLRSDDLVPSFHEFSKRPSDDLDSVPATRLDLYPDVRLYDYKNESAQRTGTSKENQSTSRILHPPRANVRSENASPADTASTTAPRRGSPVTSSADGTAGRSSLSASSSVSTPPPPPPPFPPSSPFQPCPPSSPRFSSSRSPKTGLPQRNVSALEIRQLNEHHDHKSQYQCVHRDSHVQHDALPHITIQYYNSQEGKDHKLCGELRSLYCFISPELVALGANVAHNLMEFVRDEASRFAICSGAAPVLTVAPGATDAETDNSDDEVCQQRNAISTKPLHFTIALTLDNTNIHPVHSLDADRIARQLANNAYGNETGHPSVRENWTVQSVYAAEHVEGHWANSKTNVAILDVENYGFRLMTSLTAELFITQNLLAYPCGALETSTTSTAFMNGVTAHDFGEAHSWESETGFGEEDDWSKYHVLLTVRRFEVDLLRNGTWFVSSLVIPGMDGALTLWRRAQLTESDVDEEVSESCCSSHVRAPPAAELTSDLTTLTPHTLSNDDGDVFVESCGFNIEEVVVWHASYWKLPTERLNAPMEEMVSGSSSVAESLYPAPLSFGLCWDTTHGLDAASRAAQLNIHARLAEAEGFDDKDASFFQSQDDQQSSSWDPFYGDVDILRNELWYSSRRALSMPARPPFGHYHHDVSPALLPVLFLAERDHPKTTLLDESKATASFPHVGKRHVSGGQISAAYHQKHDQQEDRRSHFVSSSLGPMTLVADPHFIRSADAAALYFSEWVRVVLRRVAVLKPPEKEVAVAPPIQSTHPADGHSTAFPSRQQENGSDRLLEKLLGLRHGLAKLVNRSKVFRDNLYVDIQLNALEVIVPHTDSIVAAPKVRAPLLLKEVDPSVVESQRASVNGIALRGLPCFLLVCLGQQAIPSAMIDTCFAFQLVTGRSEDVFMATYDTAAIGSLLSTPDETSSPLAHPHVALPPLASLLTFRPYGTKQQATFAGSEEGFVAALLHVPVLSVSLAMTQPRHQYSVATRWRGLIRRVKGVATSYSDAARAVAYPAIHLLLTKLSNEIWDTAKTKRLSLTFTIGQAVIRDALYREFLSSTALIKKYVGSSRLASNINFNPIGTLVRSEAAPRYHAATAANQISFAVEFSPTRIQGALELHATRVELVVDCLQLLNYCARCLLQTAKDLQIVSPVFPRLTFCCEERPTTAFITTHHSSHLGVTPATSGGSSPRRVQPPGNQESFQNSEELPPTVSHLPLTLHRHLVFTTEAGSPSGCSIPLTKTEHLPPCSGIPGRLGLWRHHYQFPCRVEFKAVENYGEELSTNDPPPKGDAPANDNNIYPSYDYGGDRQQRVAHYPLPKPTLFETLLEQKPKAPENTPDTTPSHVPLRPFVSQTTGMKPVTTKRLGTRPAARDTSLTDMSKALVSGRSSATHEDDDGKVGALKGIKAFRDRVKALLVKRRPSADGSLEFWTRGKGAKSAGTLRQSSVESHGAVEGGGSSAADNGDSVGESSSCTSDNGDELQSTEVHLALALENLELWVWPLQSQPQQQHQYADPKRVTQTKSSRTVDFVGSRHLQSRSDVTDFSDETFLDNGTRRSGSFEKSSESTWSCSMDSAKDMRFRRSQNVYPRDLRSGVCPLQALTQNVYIGHLTGAEEDETRHLGDTHVSGLLFSVIGSLTKNREGLQATTELIELNFMLGHPQRTEEVATTGPHSTPSSSTAIGITDAHPAEKRRPPNLIVSPQKRTMTMVGGIRVRREHRLDFPAILVGFGGGLLTPSMSARDREDCLFTIQSIRASLQYVQGPEFISLRHPQATPPFHCYVNCSIDRPYVHFTLNTLWTLICMQRSAADFIGIQVKRWRSDPPTMSQYFVEVGILHALQGEVRAREARIRQRLPLGTLTKNPARSQHLTTTDTPQLGSPDEQFMSASCALVPDFNADLHSHEEDVNGVASSSSSMSLPRLEDYGDLPLSESSDDTELGMATDEAGSHVYRECNSLLLKGLDLSSLDPNTARWGRKNKHYLKDTTNHSIATDVDKKKDIEDDAGEQQRPLQRHPTTQSTTHSTNTPREEIPDHQKKRLEHKIIGALFNLCSVGKDDVPVHVTIRMDDFSISLHDAYVQLLQIRFLETRATACIPIIQESGLTFNVLTSLTTYNPLTNTTERVLDSVGTRIALQRRLTTSESGEEFPWLDATVDIDRIGLDVSSGLLQIIKRLSDLLKEKSHSIKLAGKTKNFRVYNDTRAPLILIQRGQRPHGGRGQRWGGWHHSILYEEACGALVECPLFFAVRRVVEKSLDGDGTTVVTQKHWWSRKKHQAGPRDLEAQLTTNVETEEDLRRLAFDLLRLGNTAFVKQLNGFLRYYQKPLLYGSTRNVEFILELLADQLPMLAEAEKDRWGLSGFSRIFHILRNEPGWCPIGCLRPDYQNHRAYFLATTGYKVVVEPERRATDGQWKLCVGTAIQIVNLTNMPFKVFTSQRFGAVLRFARRLQGDMTETYARPDENTVDEPDVYTIVVNPDHRRSVPLPWFFSSRSPFIVPILESERPESVYQRLGRRFHEEEEEQPEKQHTYEGRRRRLFAQEKTPAHEALSTNNIGLSHQPFTALQRLLARLAGSDDNSGSQISIEDTILRYRRSLAWRVSVDVTDIPTNSPAHTAHKYVIRIAPYLTIHNILPFPMTIRLYASRAVTRKQRRAHAHRLSLRLRAGHRTAPTHDNIHRMLLGQTLQAHVPPNYIWCIPTSVQSLSMKIYVHGSPIETFTTAVSVSKAPALHRQQEKIRSAKNHDDWLECMIRTQPATAVYASSRWPLWLPTANTQTTRLSLTYKKSLGASLEDLPGLQPLTSLCRALNANMSSQLAPVSAMYRTFHITADASRQLVTFFAPYFAENLSHDVTLLIHSKLVPPCTRLYLSEDEAKLTRIRALRWDARTGANVKRRAKLSVPSGKLDLTSTAATRPPVCLRFTPSSGSRGHALTKRKFQWNQGARRGDSLNALTSTRSGVQFSEHHHKLSQLSNPLSSAQSHHVISVIPEESSETASDTTEEGSNNAEEPDQAAQPISQGLRSPALARIRDTLRFFVRKRGIGTPKTEFPLASRQSSNWTLPQLYGTPDPTDPQFGLDPTDSGISKDDLNLRLSTQPEEFKEGVATSSSLQQQQQQQQQHYLSPTPSKRSLSPRSYGTGRAGARRFQNVRTHASALVIRSPSGTVRQDATTTPGQQGYQEDTPPFSEGDPRRASEAAAEQSNVSPRSKWTDALGMRLSSTKSRIQTKLRLRRSIDDGESTRDLSDNYTAPNESFYKGSPWVAGPTQTSWKQAISPGGGGGGSQGCQSAVVSLGISVRYANPPYTVSKIISIMPRYYFISQLPFMVVIKDTKTSVQSLKLGVGNRSSSKEPQSQLILPPNEHLEFHTAETRCYLQTLSAGKLLSCHPFTLVPTHVPVRFQVDMTDSIGGQDDTANERTQLIQVNVVSGTFYEKFHAAPVPYAYNGLFFVLSIPEYPYYQIRNLTRYQLEFAPANTGKRTAYTEEDHERTATASRRVWLSDFREKHQRYRSKKQQRRPPPLQESNNASTAAATGAAVSHKRRPMSGVSSTSKKVQPGATVVFVPEEKLDKVTLKMRVLYVKNCPWKTIPLTTAAPTLITFEQYAAETKFNATRRRPLHTVDMATGDPGVGMGASLAAQPSQSQRPSPRVTSHTKHTAEKSVRSHRKTVLKRNLFAFLTVDSRGSRILTVTASHRLMMHLRSGQVVDTRHWASYAVGTERRLVHSDTTQSNHAGVAATALPPARQCTSQGSGKGQLHHSDFSTSHNKTEQLPWIGCLFRFRLPKTTLTWTFQNDVVLALHLSTLRFDGFAASTRLALLSGGMDLLKEQLLAATRHTSPQDHINIRSWRYRLGAVMGPWVEPRSPLPHHHHHRHHQQTRLEGTRDIRANGREIGGIAPYYHRSEHPKQDLLSAKEWMRKRRIQYNQYCDVRTQIFTNTDVSMEFRMDAIHCDHFVEGDVPVIFKSTYGVGSSAEAPFLHVRVVMSVVDPSFAPIYNDITITLSPVAANLELLVVEQLITLGEKEYALMQSAPPPVDLQLLKDTEQKRVGDPDDNDMLESGILTTSPYLTEMHTTPAETLTYGYANQVLLLRYPALEARRVASVSKHRRPATRLSLKALRHVPSVDLMSKTNLLLPGGHRRPSGVPPPPPSALSRGTSEADAATICNAAIGKDCSEHDGRLVELAVPLRECIRVLEKRARRVSALQRHRGNALALPELFDGGLQDLLGTWTSADKNVFFTWSRSHDRKHDERVQKETKERAADVTPRRDAKTAFEERSCTVLLTDHWYSHWFIFPCPRWVELRNARPVYIKSLRINAFVMTISIRTSNKQISRQVLHVVDALPLDTPYMGVQVNSEKRSYAVCTWGELVHSLRNSYLKQLIRQTLPSAWLFNPLAFVTGTWRGGRALVRATIQGARSGHPCSIEGCINGFRLGFVMLFLYSLGGLFQTCSHFGNLVHKALGGSRPRPQGVLDAIWQGVNGFLQDTFVTPWVSLVSAPATAISRGDHVIKVFAIFVVCFLRCIIAPVFGFFNFFTSMTEGFANALIGDFEQFARMQEQSDLLTKSTKRGTPAAPSATRNGTATDLLGAQGSVFGGHSSGRANQHHHHVPQGRGAAPVPSVATGRRVRGSRF